MSDNDLIRRGDALAAINELWITADNDREEGYDEGVGASLEAIAALPAVTPKVRPLEWEPSVIGKPWHSAKAPWGWYYAQWDDETQAWFASLEMGEIEAPIILSPSDVPTLEAAKAAAQADYEARSLAALDLTPAPDAAAIREAAARLPKLAYWLDTDAEVLSDMDQRDLSDHQHIQAEVNAILALIPKGGA